MSKENKASKIDKKTLIYAAIFAVASYAVSAALALSIGAYAIGILGYFLDPVVTLTVPLIIISVGIQAINKKFGPYLISLISAVLYIILPFLAITFLVAGPVIEGVSRLVGYRSFRAVMIYTTLAGGLVGILSVIFGFILLGFPHIPNLALYLVGFSVLYFVESGIMGLLSYYLGSYLIKSVVLH